MQLELGRYVGQPEEERLCPLCHNAVEAEIHVLLDCAHYQDITTPFVERAFQKYEFLKDCDRLTLFNFLVSDSYLQIDCAKTCSKVLERRQALLYR